MTPVIVRADLLLSVQRRCWGPCRPACGPSPAAGRRNGSSFASSSTVRFDLEDEDDRRIVGTEVIADFAAPATIEEQMIRVDSPTSLDGYALEAWAYVRKEPCAEARKG